MGFGGGFKGGKGVVAGDQEVSGAVYLKGEGPDPAQPGDGEGGVLYVKKDGKLYYASHEVSETAISDDLTGGGGGGIALNPAGSENQLLTRHADAMTASAEANLTFDGNILTVTGRVTASVGLSGSGGQFTTLKVGGQDVIGYYATGSNVDTNTANIATITAAYATGSDVDTNTTNITTNTAAFHSRLALTGGTLTGPVVGTQFSGSLGISGALGQFTSVTLGGIDAATAINSKLGLGGGTMSGHLTGTVIAAQELYTHEGAWPYLKISGSEISATGSGGQDIILRPKGWNGAADGPGVVSIGDAGLFLASEIWTSSSFVTDIGFGPMDIGNSTYFRIHHGEETPAHTIELTSSDGGHAHFDIKAHGNEVVAITKLKLSGAAEGNSQNFTGLGTLSASVLQGGGAGIQQLQAGNIVGTVGSATNATNVDVKNDNTDNANHYVTYVDSDSGDQRVSANAGLLFHPRFMNNTNNKLLTITGEHAELRLESSDASKRTRLIMSSSAHQWMFDADGSSAGPGNPDALVLYHSKSSGQADRLYVSASGEIGIGTTTPTRGKLDVNGAIAGDAVTASVGISGSDGQFGSATVGGTDIVFNKSITREGVLAGSLLRVHDGDQMYDNSYLIVHSGSGDVIGVQARTVANTATNLQTKITDLGTTGQLVHVTASVSVSGALGQFTTITASHIHSTNKIGVGTATPQHSLDIPDMGGLVVGYSYCTGSYNPNPTNGQGAHVTFLFDAEINSSAVQYDDLNSWVVPWEFIGTFDGVGAATEEEKNYNPFKVSFTMPASGRVLFSVPPALVVNTLMEGSDPGNTWHSDTYGHTFWPNDPTVITALKAHYGIPGSEGVNVTKDWMHISVSDQSQSYSPFNNMPRSVLERPLTDRGFSQGAWCQQASHYEVMLTGTAGTDYTAYICIGQQSTDVYRNGYVPLIFGGTGSAGQRTAPGPGTNLTNGGAPIGPSYGPLVIRVTSLPSE